MEEASSSRTWGRSQRELAASSSKGNGGLSGGDCWRARGREVSSAMGMAACCRAAGGRSRGHRAIAGRGEEGEDCRGAMDRDAMGYWRNQGAIHGKKEELAPMEWESWATLKFLRAGEDNKGERTQGPSGPGRSRTRHGDREGCIHGRGRAGSPARAQTLEGSPKGAGAEGEGWRHGSPLFLR
ncbi:hypothetical protein Zm00014a_004782 [Zea mays]|uniref:Uncharacterized protein n=1 Tax=Zea mays TaxID=4577 RepID=A0A3L6GBV3_MAIZE|nr:hypothetical protein Zm00014a_004782 [Zea mays]